MPWKPSEVDKHKKGLTQDQRVKWVRVANSVLKDTEDEGQAVRVANSKVGPKRGKS